MAGVDPRLPRSPARERLNKGLARRMMHRDERGRCGKWKMRPRWGLWCEPAIGIGLARGAGALHCLAAQQMAPRNEQIGERAGHQQAMGVLLEPAIAHLGKAEDPFDDPDRVLDPGPYLRLGTVLSPLDQVHHAALAIAAVGEVLGVGGVLPDHRALAAIGLVAPHPGLVAMQELGQHPAVGDIGRGGDRGVDQLETSNNLVVLASS